MLLILNIWKFPTFINLGQYTFVKDSKFQSVQKDMLSGTIPVIKIMETLGFDDVIRVNYIRKKLFHVFMIVSIETSEYLFTAFFDDRVFQLIF